MSKSESGSVRVNVVGGLLTAAILAGIGLIWQFMPEFWSWLTSRLSNGISHLVSRTTISNWWLYTLYLSIFGWGIFLTAIVYFSKSDKTPKITDYVEDTFFGAVWRWDYASGRGATNIWAFCPACDTALVYSYTSDFGDSKIHLHCETCNRLVLTDLGYKDDLVGKIHRQIDRNIRTGEWQKRSKNSSS